MGDYYGVSSNSVDVNKFNGTLREMYTYFGWDEIPEQPVDPVEPPIVVDPPPVDPEQDFITAYLWKTTQRLNIRTRPTISASVVRTLPPNMIVEELEREEDSRNNVWLRIGNNQYCALEYNSKNYLTPIYTEN